MLRIANRLKKFNIFFLQNFIFKKFHGQRRALQLVYYMRINWSISRTKLDDFFLVTMGTRTPAREIGKFGERLNNKFHSNLHLQFFYNSS